MIGSILYYMMMLLLLGKLVYLSNRKIKEKERDYIIIPDSFLLICVVN